MGKSLTPDDDREEEPVQVSPSQENPLQPVLEKGVSFWAMLGNLGRWLVARRVPEGVKHGARDFGQQIWYSKADYERMKSAERKFMGLGQEPRKPKKWTATPLRSFGPKEKKKGKL